MDARGDISNSVEVLGIILNSELSLMNQLKNVKKKSIGNPINISKIQIGALSVWDIV